MYLQGPPSQDQDGRSLMSVGFEMYDDDDGFQIEMNEWRYICIRSEMLPFMLTWREGHVAAMLYLQYHPIKLLGLY